MRHSLSIIIPAAGLGSRMKQPGPKQLVDVGGEPLIARQVRLLRYVFRTAQIIVVLGKNADAVARALPKNVVRLINNNPEETNVVHSMALGLEACRCERVLVVYGDLVFNEAAVTDFKRQDQSCVLVDSQGRLNQDEVGVSLDDGQVTSFGYGLPVKFGQVFFLTGQELRLFRQFVGDGRHGRHFGFEALNAVLAEDGSSLTALEPPKMELHEVDTQKDFDRLKAKFQKQVSIRR